MRVIAGSLRGRRLVTLKGLQTRPTADRVREAIFNILPRHWKGYQVLDLFAGTGAMGIEALSRGAARAVFVDHHPLALATLQRNVEALGLVDAATVIRWDARRNLDCLRRLRGVFQVIFMDPPYRSDLIHSSLVYLRASDHLDADTVVVAEQHRDHPLDPADTGWRILDQRTYGKTLVSFLSPML